MSWIVGGFVVLAVLIVGGAVAHRAYVHWLLDRVEGELPVYQVAVLDAPEGTTHVRLTLGGTDRVLELSRISAREEGVRRLGFRPPDGFEEAGDAGPRSRLAWRPVEAIPFHPGVPVELAFGYDPGADGTLPVFGHTEPAEGRGGVGAGFTVLVGRRSDLEVEASNLRSELFARARERNVPPRTLPRWSRLQELEARLASSGDDPGGGGS